tara:strand:+ start:392 stop:895 length:504 start_codon:yes stop_codon:yes gene_type:complete
MMRISILIFFLIFFTNNVSSNESKIVYVDLDFIILNSKIGKNVLKKLNELDKSNLNKLEALNKELKDNEANLKNKKNIISEEAFKNEYNILREKIKKYNNEKNKMVNDLKDLKNKELNKILKNIKPILDTYMQENSIDIILNSKNIAIANSKLDITQLILDEVNNKL